MVVASTAQVDEYIQMMRQSCLEMPDSNHWNHFLELKDNGNALILAVAKLARHMAAYMPVVAASIAATQVSNTTHLESSI